MNQATHNSEKLFAVIPIYWRRNPASRNGEGAPRFDLSPMNHAAACNWMHNCRTYFTDYRLTPWPADVPFPSPPLFAERYNSELIATR